jgi:hypothetical protein
MQRLGQTRNGVFCLTVDKTRPDNLIGCWHISGQTTQMVHLFLLPK